MGRSIDKISDRWPSLDHRAEFYRIIIYDGIHDIAGVLFLYICKICPEDYY